MNRFCFFTLGLILVSHFSIAQQNGQCSFSANQSGFDYTVDFDLSIDMVSLTQNGTTCNASVDVNYLIELTENNASPFGPVFFINLVMGCGAINDDIAVSVPNGNLNSMNAMANGTLTIGDFDFPNTDCTTLVTACDVGITMQGVGGLNEMNAPCATISQACARSVF
jgi:hypothetical protein